MPALRLSPPQTPPHLRGLLVEDIDVDAKIVALMTAMMSNYDLSLLRVGSVAAAKQAVREETFDLYLVNSWLDDVEARRFTGPRGARATGGGHHAFEHPARRCRELEPSRQGRRVSLKAQPVAREAGIGDRQSVERAARARALSRAVHRKARPTAWDGKGKKRRGHLGPLRLRLEGRAGRLLTLPSVFHDTREKQQRCKGRREVL